MGKFGCFLSVIAMVMHFSREDCRNKRGDQISRVHFGFHTCLSLQYQNVWNGESACGCINKSLCKKNLSCSRRLPIAWPVEALPEVSKHEMHCCMPNCMPLLVSWGDAPANFWLGFSTTLFTYVCRVLFVGIGIYFRSSVPVFAVLFHEGSGLWVVHSVSMYNKGVWPCWHLVQTLECYRTGTRVLLWQHSCCKLWVAVKLPLLMRKESASFCFAS